MYARKFGIVAMRRLLVCNAKRQSSVRLLIACSVGGDLEQIRETVNTGRLHARVEHNPNFVDSVRGCCSLLMALRNNRYVLMFLSRSMHPSLRLAVPDVTSGTSILSLAANTLSLAAIVEGRRVEDLPKFKGPRHPA
jgi:hypothetical protein